MFTLGFEKVAGPLGRELNKAWKAGMHTLMGGEDLAKLRSGLAQSTRKARNELRAAKASPKATRTIGESVGRGTGASVNGRTHNLSEEFGVRAKVGRRGPFKSVG